jgi:S1-C subfamily serine protease
LGILNFDKSESGLLIRSVIKDSIAHKTFGFRPGTIITKINGRPIAELSQEELLDPSFYLAVANYTTLENDVERTVPSPFKGALDETPASVRRD